MSTPNSPTSPACCGHSEPPRKNFLFRPSILWLSLAGILYGISFLSARLTPLNHMLLEYAQKMAWPMAMGLLLGGLVDYYVPQEYISKYLTRHKKRTILYATGLGFLMSACSHGILALSMELHKKGASGPAVISFLLASPWANLPVTFLLVGFFGAKGFVIVGLAIAIAFSTGLIFQVLDQKGWIEKNKNSMPLREDFSIYEDVKKRIRNFKFTWQDFRGIAQGILELSDMVMVWVVIGILLASLSAAFIPVEIFRQFFAPSFLGLLMTLIVATVMEVCSEGTAPLAFEIYRQTHALGNAFAFLMGGVVTDYTEIGLVWKNLGKRTALWMVAVTLPQVILAAILLNLFK